MRDLRTRKCSFICFLRFLSTMIRVIRWLSFDGLACSSSLPLAVHLLCCNIIVVPIFIFSSSNKTESPGVIVLVFKKNAANVSSALTSLLRRPMRRHEMLGSNMVLYPFLQDWELQEANRIKPDFLNGLVIGPVQRQFRTEVCKMHHVYKCLFIKKRRCSKFGRGQLMRLLL